MGASINGLSFVRSLARRKIPTLMLDSERLIGSYTRRGRTYLLPVPADERPEDWLGLLEFVGTRLEEPAVLFATSDVHSVFLAEQAAQLARHYRFLTPKQETMERIVNKRAQYGIAKEAGIPIPESHFPETHEEMPALASHIRYPCILKPYKSHLARKKISKKVTVVRSAEELLEQYGKLASRDLPHMIQEIIPGGDNDLYGYLAFWSSEGREHCWLTKRKLRQYPPLYGDGSLQITTDAVKVAELSRSLLRAFEYRGYVGVEFKYDARDGKYKLMEVNPRTVSGNQLAIQAGIDFPWIGYQFLINDRRPIVGDFRRGVKYVNEEWDFKSFLALRRSKQLTLAEWIRSLRDAEARAIWSWRDPLPMLVVLWRFARAFFSSLFGFTGGK
jgi:predicted ATP-grasp superfamily ATP-dependent carboligase